MSAVSLDHIDATKKTALVTGGSRGIGKAIAQRLARDGFQILLTYRSKATEAEEVCTSIINAGGNCGFAQLDIADTDAIRTFFKDIVKDRVNLNCLVNNAGITKDGLLIRMKEEDFCRVVDVCLKGTFVATQEAAKLMTKNRAGSIINLASVVGLMGNAGQANYAAAKAGIIGFTKSCAKELAARQVTCNAVAPGFIETDMTSAIPAELKEQYKEAIPLRRMGSAEDVAGAVAFLASDDARYITGQVLSVNGGMYC
ncbi:MAG: 3-oxoacyl-[acyl-carrier-protein] reductase [Desulfovibrio sp.]|nr:3-oxoacyl-[acyl-carrier-protein] reductase [Desulfovibrio sp.]